MRFPCRRTPAVLAVAGLVFGGVVGACGSDRAGGPKGDPAALIAAAPAKTVAERTAKVEVTTPDATATGTVDFVTDVAEVVVRPRSATGVALEDPLVALEVVRATAKVTPYGGAEVRGASTIRYELEIAPPEALEAQLGGMDGPTFYADVFVDSLGRIRRVTFPLDLNERRPSRTNRILAKLAVIDFYDLGQGGA